MKKPHSFYCEFHKKVEIAKEVGCKQVYESYMCDEGFEEWAFRRYAPKIYKNLKVKA